MAFSIQPTADAASGQLTLGNQVNARAGAISGSRGVRVSVSADGITKEKTEKFAMGDFSSEQSHEVNVGSEGVRSDFRSEVNVGDTQLSVEENFECCGDQLCAYSISCCGSSCTVGTECLSDVIKTIWSGISYLIDQISPSE